jgi:hypothetical protein
VIEEIREEIYRLLVEEGKYELPAKSGNVKVAVKIIYMLDKEVI